MKVLIRFCQLHYLVHLRDVTRNGHRVGPEVLEDGVELGPMRRESLSDTPFDALALESNTTVLVRFSLWSRHALVYSRLRW